MDIPDHVLFSVEYMEVSCEKPNRQFPGASRSNPDPKIVTVVPPKKTPLLGTKALIRSAVYVRQVYACASLEKSWPFVVTSKATLSPPTPTGA